MSHLPNHHFVILIMNKIFYDTLEAQSEKIVSNAIKNNALLDDKTVGGIDRRPSWWRQ